jgi:hypothetical protein
MSTSPPILVISLLSMLLPTFAFADANFESPKLSPGVVTQGSSLQSSKLVPSIIVGGAGLQSSKFSSGVVTSIHGLQSSRLSVGIIVEVLPGGGIVTRAPLTHW